VQGHRSGDAAATAPPRPGPPDDVRRTPRPPELLVPVPPFEAYREDVARLAGRAPIGASDDAWLMAAHALARAATLPPADRPELVAAAADALEGFGGTVGAAGRALRGLATALAGDWSAAPDDVAAMQHFVAEQEQAGAFQLAHTTLGALRRALEPVLGARCEGMLLAQQGRAARQLGALEAAREHYRAAVRMAREANAPDVAARALVGLGVVGNMRGNYPAARGSFRRALLAARRAGARELQLSAHHGLFVAAIAARDVDTAITHGWATVRRATTASPDERADALANLAAASAIAGEHRAALGACLAALELTDLPRVRLPALGTAVRAAAALGEPRILAHLARDVDRTVERSGQPFESAHALVELAEALLAAADGLAATGYAQRAAALAQAGGFHEMALRADRVMDAAQAAPTGVAHRATVTERPTGDATARPPRVRAVLRSMESLPALRRYTASRT
jgi:tetratricopeptide (TPR) repeat protein